MAAPSTILLEAQRAFDAWGHRYNHHRPHDALNNAGTANRYRSSPRSFSARVEPFEYGPDDIVRRVERGRLAQLRGRRMKASKALNGKQVAIRPTGARRDLRPGMKKAPCHRKSIDFHKGGLM